MQQWRPAYGTYDPTLDQQERSADRGLSDHLQDLGKLGERDLTDYGIAKEDAGTSLSRMLEDIGFSRSDLLTSRQRGRDDFNASLQTLDRNYRQLGQGQAQTASRAGATGGAFAQAAQKRAANKAIDRQPLQTNFDRFLQDSTTAESRLGTTEGRVRYDSDRDQGRLAELLRRNTEDRGTQGTRAERENEFFHQDLNEVRVDQAKMAGFLPEPRVSSVGPRRRRRSRRSRYGPGAQYGTGRVG